MNRINLGKVRGTSIYTGEAITGTNSLGAVFVDTGISEGYVGDLYINTKANTEDCGNVYECLQSGTAAEAVWGYKGNIRGPQVILDDTLESTSRTKALSAYQGKVLNEKIVNSGCYAKSVPVVNDAVVHGIKVLVENESTTVTVTIGGKVLSGTYVKNKTGTEGSVTIVAGTDAGVVTQISSTNAYIKAYTLYDSSSEEIFSKELKVWDYVGELMGNITSSGNIIDGTETVKTGIMSKLFGNIRKNLYPITHAKAVWFDKSQNKTVYDEMEAIKGKLGDDEYNPEQNYLTGDICIQNNSVWRFKENKGAGEWDPNKVKKTSLKEIDAENRAAISTLNANIQPLISEDRINVKVNIEVSSLNTPERTGIYYVTGDNIQALPSGFSTYGLLFVMRSPYSFHPTNKDSVYSQLYIDVYNNRATRAFNNGAWTDWKNF